MLHIWDLDRYLGLISPDTPQRLIRTDIWRIQNSWFGPHWCPRLNGGILLELGGRSGLHALHAATANASSRVFVIEPHPVLAQCLQRTFDRAATGNLTVFRDVDEALAGIAGEPKIEVLKVDHEFDNAWSIVKQLLVSFSVDHVAGEFDPTVTPAMEAFRISRRYAESFYWRLAHENWAFTGKTSDRLDVSIIVPAYRVAQWLPRCLQSLVEQELESKEIIVVDDGSPDETGQIADQWAARYSETIRVIHKENGGCASARNAGLLAARGEYVGFVDADDWCDPPMYEALFGAAVLNNADIAQCGFRRVSGDEQIIEDVRELEPIYAPVDGGAVRNPIDLLQLQPTIWRRIYHRDFLIGKKLQFPAHIRMYDDLPFQFEALCQANRIVLIPEIYYNWRVGREGQDISTSDRRLFVHFDLFDYLRKRISPWASFAVERHLVQVELKSHMWAISRLQACYRKEYLCKAAQHVFMPRNTLSRWFVVRDAFRASAERGLFAVRCVLIYWASRFRFLRQ